MSPGYNRTGTGTIGTGTTGTEPTLLYKMIIEPPHPPTLPPHPPGLRGLLSITPFFLLVAGTLYS